MQRSGKLPLSFTPLFSLFFNGNSVEKNIYRFIFSNRRFCNNIERFLIVFVVPVVRFCVSVPFVQNSGRVGSKLFYWYTRRKTYRNVNRGPVPLLFVLRFLCGMRVRKDTETRHSETRGVSVHMVLSCCS